MMKNQTEITNELLMSIKAKEDALKLQFKQEINPDIGVMLVEQGQNDKTTKIAEMDEEQP